MDKIQIIILVLGWALFILSIIMKNITKKKWQITMDLYKKSNNDWAFAYRSLENKLLDLKTGRRKSFEFAEARFRLVYLNKNRGPKGKFTKGPKEIKDNGVIKLELNAKK